MAASYCGQTLKGKYLQQNTMKYQRTTCSCLQVEFPVRQKPQKYSQGYIEIAQK